MIQFLDSFMNDVSIIACAAMLIWVAISLKQIETAVRKLLSSVDRFHKVDEKKQETCFNCQKEILPGAKFCHTCGKDLVMTCGDCGAMMPLESHYCPNCRKRMWFEHMKGEK